MPSFFVRKKFFLQYASGLKDVELKNIQPRWKNTVEWEMVLSYAVEEIH